MNHNGIAGYFAVTKRLEQENKELKEELAKARQAHSDLLEKLFLAIGLHTQPDPVYVQHTEEPRLSAITPSDMVKQAEMDDWEQWQREERERLAQAALTMQEFRMEI